MTDERRVTMTNAGNSIGFFVLCYTGLIIPVVGVGVASVFIGDFAAVLAFSVPLAAVSLIPLASIRRAL